MKDWYWLVIESFSNPFFYQNEAWIFTEGEKLMERLFFKNKSPEVAARIIERIKR